MSAETLTPQEALQRAGRSNIARAASKTTQSMDLVFTQNTVTDSPAVYVFQSPKANGYLFVPADDVAVPVLGYADSGNFDAENMAPGLKAWLQEYARQIQYAVTMGNLPSSYDVQVVGNAVAPLMKTKWDQGSPYNLKTPMDGNSHCVTGCVATAMAQVMKYWEYPAVGKGTAVAYVNNVATSPLDLSTITFDWKNMLDDYSGESTEVQKNAVADLMVACGYSVAMGYTAGESGAQSANLVTALVNNFGYNKNIQLLDRNFYSGSEWNKIVYGELKAGRPVLYAGQSLTGAHQFVVDGYNADGYFHLNWGWGGMSDGYYTLDALTPGAQGTGGSAGGYNFGQSIIQGVQIENTPDSEKPEIAMTIGSGIKATVSGLMMTITGSSGAWLQNGSSESIWGCMAVMIDGVTDTSYSYRKGDFWCIDQNNPLLPRYGWSDWSLSNIQFPDAAPDGKYKVTLAFLKKPQNKYIPVLCNGANYFYVTKTGNSLKVENINSNARLTVKAEVPLTLYEGCLNKFKFTAKNESDHEITEGVYPALYDSRGNMVYNCEGYMITLQPGEEYTKEFAGELNLLKDQTGLGSASSADYTFMYFDPISWSPYDNTSINLKLCKVTGTKSVACSTPVLVGLEQKPISDSTGKIKVNGYTVGDPGNLKVKCTINNTGTAYFAYPFLLAICEYNASSTPIYTPYPNDVILNPGQSYTIETTVALSNYTDGKLYQIAPIFRYDGDYQWPNTLSAYRYAYFTVDTSGVADVFGEGESAVRISYDKASGEVEVSSDAEISQVRVFGVDGKELGIRPVYDGNRAIVSLADLQGGVYVVLAKDARGRNKALKIAK